MRFQNVTDSELRFAQLAVAYLRESLLDAHGARELRASKAQLEALALEAQALAETARDLSQSQ